MTKRYLSLDVLRGLTVAFMIIVNNPGSWKFTYPMLKHAAWDGCTPCDLVFPFFLFCVGTSMAFALAKFESVTKAAVAKIFKRGVLLYLVGILLMAFPFYPQEGVSYSDWFANLRLLGILPRIAMCYVVASLLVLWLKKPVRLIWTVVILSLIHVGLLVAFPGSDGPFTPLGGFAQKIDLAVFGEGHIYKLGYNGGRIPFDPEGLLGVLTGTCTVILGYLVGMLIRSSAKRYEQKQDAQDSPVGVSAKLFSLSAGALLLGLALSTVVPINKALWTVSYVFYTAGWAMFVLALLMYMIDVRGWEKPFFPFKALGMNALALFALSGLLMRTIRRIIEWNYTELFGANEEMSLLFSILFLSLHLVVAIVLYKKKIFIKL